MFSETLNGVFSTDADGMVDSTTAFSSTERFVGTSDSAVSAVFAVGTFGSKFTNVGVVFVTGVVSKNGFGVQRVESGTRPVKVVPPRSPVLTPIARESVIPGTSAGTSDNAGSEDVDEVEVTECETVDVDVVSAAVVPVVCRLLVTTNSPWLVLTVPAVSGGGVLLLDVSAFTCDELVVTGEITEVAAVKLTVAAAEEDSEAGLR